MRQTEIADAYGVSRQYVYKLLKHAGHESQITEITDNLPWEIDLRVTENTVYQAVRKMAHINLAGADSLPEASRQKARALVRKLTRFNQVIDYDPSYPAVPGLTNTPGFAYVPRTTQDEDFAVKIRPGVRITPLGNKIWRIPADDF
jgi:hypothetical protein